MSDNPETGKSIDAAGVKTNYHDMGEGRPVILIHGSGPGVTAWANWRLNLPALAQSVRAIAPDMLGFGYTERPSDGVYTMERWRGHLMDLADALDLQEFDIIGNSAHHPDRIRRMVLMGAAGLEFELTEALDKVWGYEPSVQAMREMLDIFAYDNSLVSDELAEMRYRASIQPGFHEAFSAMFPAPRQQHVTALATPEDEIAKIACPTLILHGREDRVLPMSNSLRLFDLIKTSEVHLFGKCGHWTQIEHKDRFNLLVSDFLASA